MWGILLSKYNDQRDAVFGAVVSGRPPQLEYADEIVGLFINTVPVRIRYEQEMPLSELFQHMHTEIVASETFHHFPLAEVQNLSELKNLLFDHILVFEIIQRIQTLRDLQ